jgi:hypothetical protein
MFVAHMYIVFRCLSFLQQELKYGIRIGHGIAFDHIIGADLNSSKYRKSSVLMAEMRADAYELFKNIAFEVNITSNEYLLGQKARKGDYSRILRLKELFGMEAHITLGTDDDRVWPIDQCSSVHPGHQSLAAEYCRALSTSLIDSEKDLLRTFETMKRFCFWDMGDQIQRSFIENADSNGIPYKKNNTVIVHPNIIKSILKQYKAAPVPQEIHSALENFKMYEKDTSGEQQIAWDNEHCKLCVAFVCICASQNHNKENLSEHYYNLFGRANPDYMDEFNFIYDNYQNIISKFVECNTNAEPSIILGDTQNEQILHLIRSAQSQTDDPLQLLSKLDLLNKEINIRDYVTDMGHKAAISHLDTHPGKGTLHIFTNTKKYVFSYKTLNGKVICQVNPTPSKRNETAQNFLYVLCHHASAATAAFHLISEQLSKFSQQSPASSLSALTASAGGLNNQSISGSESSVSSPSVSEDSISTSDQD